MTSCFGEAHKAAVLFFFPFKASLKKHWPVFIIYKSAFWIPALFLAPSSYSHLYICRASLPLFRLVCLGAGPAFLSIPCFFSVEDCQGLSRHNSLHTLCSHQPHEEEVGGGMMSPSTNNNHPASELSSTSPGFLATPWLSHQPLAFCKPFAFPCYCNGSNHR